MTHDAGERGTPTESGDPLDSPEGLAEFVSALLGQPHDYDSSARAAMQAAVMAFNLVAGRLGLTGFQGSWAALNAYSEIMGYRCPLIVIKAEDALYPQYDLPGRLAEWMENCKPWLGEQAREKLADVSRRHAAGAVIDHWKRLAKYPAAVETEGA